MESYNQLNEEIIHLTKQVYIQKHCRLTVKIVMQKQRDFITRSRWNQRFKDCNVLTDPLVKTFTPFNGRRCTRNGFMGRNAIHGAEMRSPLVKYNAYLLIRNKLYPHYRAHFFIHISRPGSFSFCCLAVIGRDQSTAHLQQDPRRYR